MGKNPTIPLTVTQEKLNKIFDEKKTMNKAKIINRFQVYKGYASSDNVEILLALICDNIGYRV